MRLVYGALEQHDNILVQFLIESMILTLLGGFIGLLLGCRGACRCSLQT